MAGGDEEAPLPRYVFVQMADDIETRIASGEIPVGAKLPGERELSQEYEVSVDTTRRAMRVLRERGLVATLPPKGTYVIRRRPSPPSE